MESLALFLAFALLQIESSGGSEEHHRSLDSPVRRARFKQPESLNSLNSLTPCSTRKTNKIIKTQTRNPRACAK